MAVTLRRDFDNPATPGGFRDSYTGSAAQKESGVTTGTVISREQRKEALEMKLARAVADGWIIVSRTDAEAKIARPKRFNWPLFLIGGFITAGVIAVVYLIQYAASTGEVAAIFVAEDGTVRVDKSVRGSLRG
jgi:hypothetical protein